MNTSFKFIFIIFITLISISNEHNNVNEENKKENIIIKYLLKSSNTIEIITTKIISKLINDFNIEEPFDFGCFFILGIIVRILMSFITSKFKNNDNYVYNTPDTAEYLYKIINQLNELSNKMVKRNENNNNNNDNNDNNINDNENENNDFKKMTDEINLFLNKFENSIKNIEDEIKKNQKTNEEILTTIEDCQKEIQDSISTPQ